MAVLAQGLLCLQAKPDKQEAEEGDWDDQELLQPGTQTPLARASAVCVCPGDVQASRFFFLVWMSNVQRSGFHSLGGIKAQPKPGCYFDKGESLLRASMTNLARCGLCGQAAAG